MLKGKDDNKRRCDWALADMLSQAYHDTEWGIPVHDDRMQFEFLVLETFQAGLSWSTILRKRENFDEAFCHFDPQRVAQFDQKKTRELMQNEGIIRNKRKIAAAVVNAKAFLMVAEEFGSFDSYIWGFVGNRPIRNRWMKQSEVPAMTKLSETISRDLFSRGFGFVGPIVCYAHMQATGMVNDHLIDCFRHKECNVNAEFPSA